MLGCDTKPTRKSETDSEQMSTLEGECKDGVLHIEIITKALPNIAMTAQTALMTIDVTDTIRK